jgi:hypothetical protein
MEWSGQRIYNTQVLVCDRCYDRPNETLRTLILPPDPLPVLNARVPDLAYEEQTPRIIQFADPLMPPPQQPWAQGPQMLRATQDGEQARVIQYLTSS